MYKVVETPEEEQLFNGIWTQAWLEKGFELEFSTEVLGRCIVYDDEQESVATAEIKPYSPNKDFPLNQLAPFAEHPAVIAEPGQVSEVDKVALLKEHRGKNLDRLLATIVFFSEEHEIRHLVALLDPLLSRALRISFHVPMSKVGTKFFYKGADVVPAIIHVAEIYEHKEQFDWVMENLKHSKLSALST
ncbi:hypothetical protein ACFQ3W_03175 [Paenibacillus puldeungensis]|uniref:N-acetyltransferase domain-containing protein n=1 Tax=Paenibacillus puldeungensis TaxID=696536 RepID=A0ABW3RSV5_9BACL